MKKKNIVLKVFIIFTLIMSIFSVGVNAQSIKSDEGLFDVEMAEGVYKYSENEDIYLPFIRFATDRILVDKNLTGFGTSFSAGSIEVNSDIEGMQILFAGDSIRVNNKMEYGVLFATTNATISSEIEKSLIVFAGEKITITEDAKIKGDIICFGSDLEVNGVVEGSIIGACDKVTVNGAIEKDLRVETSNIDLKENAIKGKLYVETYNSELRLPSTYENGKLNLLFEQEEKGFDFSIIYMAVITAAVFTLIYFLINKISKDNIIEKGIDKVKSNPIVVVLSGSISLMIIPAVVIILTILSAIGLYMVAIPAMIIYLAFTLVVSLLSTLIVGTLISEYMSNSKYLKDKGTKTKYLFAFIMFMVLYVFARLPYIGGYVTVLLVMIAIGSALCMIFCKSKKKV